MRWVIVFALLLVSVSAPASERCGFHARHGTICATRDAVGRIPLNPPPDSVVPPPTALASRGYNSRASGLESTDICDATETTPGGAMSSDVLPGERYVTLGEGSDVSTCGLQGFEGCNTLVYAAAQATAGDTICVRGTSGEANVTLAASGPTPSNRTRIVGWDYDGDDSYPPHDTDDIADLVADSVADTIAIVNNGLSNTEYAHLRIQDYGDISFGGVGTIGTGIDLTTNVPTDYVYIHDIRFIDVNRGRVADSERAVINVFGAGGEGSGTSTNLWVFNNSFESIGGYVRRGGCSTCSEDFMTGEVFRNNSVTQFGADGDFVSGWKGWGPTEEIIDENVLIVLPGWTPAAGNGATAISTGPCERATIANNTISGYRNPILPQPFASGFCDDEASSAARTATVSITGNQLNMDATAFPTAQAIRLDAGGDDPTEQFSSVLVQGNTVCGPTGSGQANFYSFAAVAGLSFGTGNTWEPDGGYVWEGSSQADFATWQTASGDSSSTEVSCDYPVASAITPDWTEGWEVATGTGDAALRIGSTFDSSQGTTPLLEVKTAASLGVTAPGGSNVLSASINNTLNRMLVKDVAWDITDRCRYWGKWDMVRGDFLSTHDFQDNDNQQFSGSTASTFFMGMHDNITPGAGADGTPEEGTHKHRIQSYASQSSTPEGCPTDNDHIASFAQTISYTSGAQGDVPHPTDLPFNTWHWIEQKICALGTTTGVAGEANGFDVRGDGVIAEADDDVEIGVHIYTRIWNADGTLRNDYDTMWSQGVGAAYDGSGPGYNLHNEFTVNGECFVIHGDTTDLSIGVNGQAGETATTSDAFLIDDVTVGGSTTDIGFPSTPWVAPPNGWMP